LMVECNRLKATVDVFIARVNSDAFITPTMIAAKAKSLYESLQTVL